MLQKFEITYRYANGIEVIYTNGGKPSVRVEGTDGWIENIWFQSDGFKASKPELLKWMPGPNDISLPCVPEKQDFIDCIRSRRETIIPAEIGHRATSMCQIGFIAATLGAKLKWDPAAEKFIGSDEANRMLSRPMRAPWTISL